MLRSPIATAAAIFPIATALLAPRDRGTNRNPRTGVQLLMSEAFYQFLSPAAKLWCRQVDRVRKRGHMEPMGLYTFDCHPDQITSLPGDDEDTTAAVAGGGGGGGGGGAVLRSHDMTSAVAAA
ncbi:unnamed protein product, partial [Phaeothamnion confervicola]